MKKYPIFEHINHNRYILIFLCDILAFLRNRQINEGCFLCLFDLLLWYIMSKCWVILYLVFILCRPLFILCTSCYCYITIRAQNPPIPSSIPNWSLLYSSAIQKSTESSKTDFSSYSSSCPLKNSPPYN